MSDPRLRSIAQETGYTLIQIRAICRDLQIRMDYEAATGEWSVSEPAHADMLIEMLNEQD